MDFFQIMTRETRGGVIEVYPDFTVGRSKDLMVRGGSFYAIYDETTGLWSTDEYDVQRIVDEKLHEYAEDLKSKGVSCTVKYLRSFTSRGWEQFRRFMKNVSDNSHQLDQKLTFLDTVVKKTDYVSKRLPYPLASGDHSSWDALMDKLYSPDEKAKIEWTIGAIISGESKKLQKFLVLYGPGGTGKSTVLNIVNKLFDGYIATFEAKALVGNNNSFATEAFKHNPLVAIQHDGDLSKIEDNTKLNSIVSHEEMTINEKYKASYTTRINAMLLMGTNKPVRITDAKSGIIRRLIDAHPTGSLFSPNEYYTHLSKIDFELGAIAHHCLETYRSMGKNYYNSYRPLEMMLQTDVFFNFIEANYDIFKSQNGVSLKQAYELYKEFRKDTGIEWQLPQYKFRDELRNYFDEFYDRKIVDGVSVRSYYSGFKARPFKAPLDKKNPKVFSLVMEETVSLLDEVLSDCPAQYGNAKENPTKYWTDEERLIDGELTKPNPSQVVDTTLSDLDTSKLHYVKPPENHIVIDFDIKDEDGRKSLERNLAAASEWPPTYGELSKSGSGIHLHYNYTGGDVSQLSPNFDKGIEVKVFRGNASLRRALSRCNSVPVADLNSGLPLKEKKVLTAKTIQSERGLRELITRNLRKEIHAGTKPSVDFIHKILEDAHKSGMPYDVTDMRSHIIAFAGNSTNWSPQCIRVVKSMRFSSEENAQPVRPPKDEPIAFFDIECFPNLFVICWSYHNSDTVVRMINPSPHEVEDLFRLKLVGFNNRQYDNHMLWAAMLGYNLEQLYKLSQNIVVEKNRNALFGEAYGISYTDVLDFSSKKQSLKKFQIELDLPHVEMDIPWDQPVPRELWNKVVDYCANDVVTLKSVFDSRRQDWAARQILADLSGLTVNDTTNKHTAKIIFGSDSNPKKDFVYTHLSEEFPGYKYERGESTYRGEVTGEGGYVYATPGMYDNVTVFDVASMHPSSIIALNLFGDKYTAKFKELLDARLAIKRQSYAKAKSLLDGKLGSHISEIESFDDKKKAAKAAKALADALKIVINSVYGLTSAKFDNPFNDPRNVDNIVAKRGALFMIDLKHFVQDRGYDVVHIKTDSIKIPDVDADIATEVMAFGEKYGYTFEVENYYDKFCLVNDAVYVAREDKVEPYPHWEAKGAQFQHPYVYKALFTQEPFTFRDYCETKQVSQGHIYIDFDGGDKPMALTGGPNSMHFIGRTGLFVPVKEGCGGGILYRVKGDKRYAVTGTKGYFWIEADKAKELGEDAIDKRYFEKLAEDARAAIDFFGPFSEFVSTPE